MWSFEKKRSRELTSWLGLQDTLNELARASGVRWYGHALRRDNDKVLRRGLDFEMVGKKVWATEYGLGKGKWKNILIEMD